MSDPNSGLPFLPETLAGQTSLDTAAPEAFERLVEAARADPGYALALLRAANSVSRRRVRACLGVREAVTRLGVMGAYDVLVARPVVRVVMSATHPAVRQLIEHSLQVARGAEFLAQLTGAVEPDIAYAAGIAHDIGHYALLQAGPKHLADLDAATWCTPDELASAEEALGHDDHARVGSRHAVDWALPPALVYAIRHHHDAVSVLDPRLQMLVQLLRWADAASIALLRGGQVRLERSEARRPLVLPPDSELVPALMEAMTGRGARGRKRG